MALVTCASFSQSAEPASAGKIAGLRGVSLAALRLAVQDLVDNFHDRYPQGSNSLDRIATLEKEAVEIEAAAARKDATVTNRLAPLVERFQALQREALLANPLLDFDKLLLVKRASAHEHLGLPQNWQGNCALPATGYTNEIAVLSPVGPQGKLSTLFKPEGTAFVGDVDLHFDGDRLMFSMPNPRHRWGIWEIKTDGGGLRQISPTSEVDVD
ncbi:MAG: hypothetical protein NTW03_22650, partial [Verrucomicrobia bacterium]|nr:hypothetical protein [Verrucomicrobiota bacterium]